MKSPNRWLPPAALLPALAFYLLSAASPATAHDTTCQRLAYSQGELICPPPSGGLMTDINGSTVCGPGYCARDSYGKVKCSSLPGGSADLDQYGNVVCVGGCVDGATSYCVAPRP